MSSASRVRQMFTIRYLTLFDKLSPKPLFLKSNLAFRRSIANRILANTITMLMLAVIIIKVSCASEINTDTIDRIKSDIHEQKLNSKCLLKASDPIINHPNKYQIFECNKLRGSYNTTLKLNNGKVVEASLLHHNIKNKPLLSLNAEGFVYNNLNTKGFRIDLDNMPLNYYNLKNKSILNLKNLTNSLLLIFHFEFKDQSTSKVRKKN